MSDQSEPTTATSQPANDSRRGELTFIGTATVLLRFGSFTILTDPNFLHQGDYAKLGGGLRSRRLTDPALTIDELPPLDFVVLSHHHGDHFDEVAQRDLDKDLRILTTPHAAKKLRRQGFRAPVAMQTWQSHTVTNTDETVQVTSLPGLHAPNPLAKVLPPVMGSLLEYRRAGGVFRLYITGDTLIHDRLQEIPRRYPTIDLSLLHLGGTKVMGILLTMDASQGIQMLELTRPRTAVPIHYDDYTVFKSPLSDFQRAVHDMELTTQVSYVDRGETYEFGLP